MKVGDLVFCVSLTNSRIVYGIVEKIVVQLDEHGNHVYVRNHYTNEKSHYAGYLHERRLQVVK